MSNIIEMPIGNIKPNPKNPRVIRDEKYKKLVQSIKSFPDMLNKRPLICFTDADKKVVVLGGNMRLKASLDLGLKTLPVILADEWTEEQKAEFLIKDNVSFGEWDWEQLANEWDSASLGDWGLDVWQPEKELFNTDEEEEQSATAPKASDDGYSVFELVMKHENKLRLLEILNQVKEDNEYEKQEDALMEIIETYIN